MDLWRTTATVAVTMKCFALRHICFTTICSQNMEMKVCKCASSGCSFYKSIAIKCNFESLWIEVNVPVFLIASFCMKTSLNRPRNSFVQFMIHLWCSWMSCFSSFKQQLIWTCGRCVQVVLLNQKANLNLRGKISGLEHLNNVENG